MILRDFEGKSPVIDSTAWIAENAVIIGDVTIGPRVNIWYNVVIRGPEPVALLDPPPGAPWSVDVDPESLL